MSVQVKATQQRKLSPFFDSLMWKAQGWMVTLADGAFMGHSSIHPPKCMSLDCGRTGGAQKAPGVQPGTSWLRGAGASVGTLRANADMETERQSCEHGAGPIQGSGTAVFHSGRFQHAAAFRWSQPSIIPK